MDAMTTTVIFQIQSLLIFSLMTLGIYLRKNRRQHIRIMILVIIWDLLLIAQIEVSRSAVLKASKALSNPIILNTHVMLALSSVILYCFMFYTGLKMIKGQVEFKGLHKILGYSTYVIRLLTLITSFWVVIAK